MSGEIKLFRRELFGGFARRDVIEYIRKLAGERNEYSSAQREAEAEITRLGAAMEELRVELDTSNLMIQQVRVSALTEAQRVLDELGNAYDEVRTDIEETANRIRGELTKAADTVSLMTQILERAGARFSELSGIVASEKEIIDAELLEIIPSDPNAYRDPESILDELKIPPRAPRPELAVDME